MENKLNKKPVKKKTAQQIVDENKKVVLFHYPIMDWEDSQYGSIHLYGHVHQKDNLLFPIDNRYHIGVDTNDFKPVSLEQILNK